MGVVLTVQGVSTPNPHIVHGSTIHYFKHYICYCRHLHFLLRFCALIVWFSSVSSCYWLIICSCRGIGPQATACAPPCVFQGRRETGVNKQDSTTMYSASFPPKFSWPHLSGQLQVSGFRTQDTIVSMCFCIICQQRW